MKLSEARVLFNKIRIDSNRIVSRPHIFRDHPERKFTPAEVLSLIQGKGKLTDNNKMPTAQTDSFMWFCKEQRDRACELAVRFEISAKEIIVVVHVFREI